jgi:hypothetical protein
MVGDKLCNSCVAFTQVDCSSDSQFSLLGRAFPQTGLSDTPSDSLSSLHGGQSDVEIFNCRLKDIRVWSVTFSVSQRQNTSYSQTVHAGT